ncbi:MAG: rod-binding protein [Desulfococcaceae bacterium]|jgi:flagellar protein FlgJ|nr:rod-binding protein [Desulfococcaceae bacterium]
MMKISPDMNAVFMLKTESFSKKESAGNADMKNGEAVCHEMESLFLHHLLREMRASVPASGLWGKNNGEKIFTDMLDGQLASELSAKGGIGLALMLMEQLQKKGE